MIGIKKIPNNLELSNIAEDRRSFRLRKKLENICGILIAMNE